MKDHFSRKKTLRPIYLVHFSIDLSSKVKPVTFLYVQFLYLSTFCTHPNLSYVRILGLAVQTRNVKHVSWSWIRLAQTVVSVNLYTRVQWPAK